MDTHIKQKNKPAWILYAAIAIILYWVFESVVHTFIVGSGGLIENLFHPDGEEVWMRLFTMAVISCLIFYFHYSSGKVKKLSEASESGSANYKALFEESRDAIYVRTRDGRFIDLNKSMLEMFGYTKDEMMEINVEKLYVYPENLKKFEAEVNRNEFVREYHQEFFRKDGRRIECNISSTLWKSPEGDVRGYHGIIRDVTELNHALRDLETSRERYRNLIDSADDLIYTHNLEGQFTSINKKVMDITGYSEENGTGLTFHDVVAPEYLKTVSQMLKKKMGGEEITNYEIEIIAKDGRRIPVEINSRLIYEDKKVVGVLGIARDITDRLKARDDLREREQFLSNIFNSIQDGMCVLDLEFNIIRINPVMEKRLPDSTPVIGRKCYEAFHHSGQICENCPSIRTLRTGRMSSEVIHYDNGPDTSAQWLEIYSYPLMDINSGQLKGIIEYVRDVTDKKNAEASLAGEKDRLSVTLQSIGDGVITTNVDGNITLINNVAESLTGWKEYEAAGKPLHEIFNILNGKTRARYENTIERIMDHNTAIRLSSHTVLVSRTGKERIIAENGAPIKDRKGDIVGYVIVFRDITESKKMEDEYLKTQKLESIGTLAGGIAHDYNNILTIITANAALLKTLPDIDNRIMDIVRDIEIASSRAKDLTKQLLIFSKGGAPIKKSASISNLLKDTAEFALSGSSVKSDCKLEKNLWPVLIDKDQISQVIYNLILNSRQAMPEGGRVEVRAENVYDKSIRDLPLKPGKYVKISVKDYGAGIKRDIMDKIFDPFFSTRDDGAGLGLAISYSIIKKHDGHISVKSDPEEGTTFYLYLPAGEEEPAAENDETVPAMKGEGRILIMDDEENILQVTGALLKYLGYEIELARDGEEAIRKYSESAQKGKPFNLVIMDLTVPGKMGGRECIRILREIEPEVISIVSSGYSNDPVMSNFRDYGFNGVLAKPYKLEDLGMMVGRLLIGEKKKQ
jgi:PAS domain S-box-containing protein